MHRNLPRFTQFCRIVTVEMYMEDEDKTRQIPHRRTVEHRDPPPCWAISLTIVASATAGPAPQTDQYCFYGTAQTARGFAPIVY